MKTRKIKSIRRRPVKVYNLSVRDNRNYFANSILTHNCDDPHSAQEALSDARRKSAVNWWDNTMATRMVDPETAVKVIIMQRLHELDLSGHLLARDLGYEHLCLPAEYEGVNRCFTSLGFVDPRKEMDEPLHPGRFNAGQLRELKAELDLPYTIAGQLQQRPAPLEGGMVKWEWFRRYTNTPPKGEYLTRVQVWDTAVKPDELVNAPWVCGTWDVFHNGFYLLDVVRKWMDYPAGRDEAKRLARRWNPSVIVIEDKATGSSLIQELGQDPKFRFSVLGFEPEGDKVTRLAVESTAIEGGLVHLPEDAPWLKDFRSEVTAFPKSATKDQVDMLSMFLKFSRRLVPELQASPLDERGDPNLWEQEVPVERPWDHYSGTGERPSRAFGRMDW
jgi:predicted phage terminase large subunit-like protein